jgi:DNA polymerase III subunit epsilon
LRLFRRTPLGGTRWVAIDCETSGLNMARDRLLSVGAVAVHGGRIDLSQSFHAFVQQEVASAPENILIHGIGGDAQRQGRPLVQVIEGLAGFIGEALPVGFHAPFDAAILRRHGLRLRGDWLDLARVAPALFPGRAQSTGALEDWLGAFDIPVHARHDALGDAFSTAQLLLVVLAEANRQRLQTVEALYKAERAGRWLARN